MRATRFEEWLATVPKWSRISPFSAANKRFYTIFEAWIAWTWTLDYQLYKNKVYIYFFVNLLIEIHKNS